MLMSASVLMVAICVVAFELCRLGVGCLTKERLDSPCRRAGPEATPAGEMLGLLPYKGRLM